MQRHCVQRIFRVALEDIHCPSLGRGRLAGFGWLMVFQNNIFCFAPTSDGNLVRLCSQDSRRLPIRLLLLRRLDHCTIAIPLLLRAI